MKVVLKSDFPVSDDGCRASTGKGITEWIEALKAAGMDKGRREGIQWLYDQMGRGKDTWWATTVWVEHERILGIVNKKDGLAEGYNICATKTVMGTPADVYNAWLAAHAPAAEGTPHADADGNTGTWLRLRPGKDARISWKSAGVQTPSMVDATFADKGGGKTGIVVNHARIQTREEADGLRNAWAAMLDELKTKLG